MRKMTAALAVASLPALGACTFTMPTFTLGNQVNLNTIEGVIAGYGVMLNAELTYRALPLCKTGAEPSITNICAKRSVIEKLQAADKVANAAVNAAVTFVKANPTVDPSSYLSAARDALTGLRTVLDSANATGT